MDQIDIFQTNFYRFVCSDELTEKVLEKVKTLKYKKNSLNQITCDDLLYDEELFDWFDSCLNKVKNQIGLPSNITIPITSCWANKSKKLMAHHKHNHPNSFISGIFYLTDHGCAPTIFYEQNCWTKKLNKFFSIDDNKFVESTKKIYPKKSTLILFPSYVSHSVAVVNTNEERYTISFNTYISGFINQGKNNNSRLEIKIKSVRDHYENKEI